MKSIAIYDPMAPAARAANSIFAGDDLFNAFDRFFEGDSFFGEGFRSPRIDIKEEDVRYLIEAELPGLSEEDVKLEVKDGVLELSAKKGEKQEEKEGTKWLRRERSEFSFSRRFGLPEDADLEKIQASFRNGVLSVELPKKPEAAPRHIPVKAA